MSQTALAGRHNHQQQIGKAMHKSTLEAVGLKTQFDIPAEELFSVEFDPRRYGMEASDRAYIGCLRDFVEQYNREVPVDTRKPVVNTPTAVEALYPVLRALDHEEVWVLYLSSASLPIKKMLIGRGSLNATLIDNRAVVKLALDLNASRVILYHNHPSGNPRPSGSDIEQTSRLKKALSVFDMELTDHIIISEGCYFSFQEETVRRIHS